MKTESAPKEVICMAHKYEGRLPVGFEMKQCYQPNMLKALGTVTFVAVATGIIMHFSNSGKLPVSPDPAKRRAENQVHVTQVEKPVDRARRQYGSLNPYAQKHEGFAGFNGYHIVPNAPEVRPKAPPKVYTHEALLPVSSDDASYADLPGDSVGIGLPTLDTAEAIPPEVDTTTKQFANQPVELIYRKLPEVPWLAQENEREGHVDVLIYVDADGKPAPYACRAATPGDFILDVRLKNKKTAQLGFFIDSSNAENQLVCVIVKEDPSEYSFADNLTAVLPEWKFKPRIVNSKPVGSFVIIGFNYCVPSKHPEGCPEITLTPA